MKKGNEKRSSGLSGIGLDHLIRRGARQVMGRAIEAELAQLLKHYENVKTLGGRRAVVRKGYLPELGFPRKDSPPEVAFFTLDGAWLGLYGREALAEGATVSAEGQELEGFSLAHNVRSEKGGGCDREPSGYRRRDAGEETAEAVLGRVQRLLQGPEWPSVGAGLQSALQNLAAWRRIEEADMGAQWKTKIKETTAAAKGKVFTKLAKEIMVAARAGADPDMNPRLRMAVEQAKKASMPKDNIERAIRKGAGLDTEGANYQKVVYEGFAPHRVPVIVECLTDNPNRTVTSVRMLFRKGQLGTTGSVSWDFDYLGMIEATPQSPGADPEAAAIEAGASDFEPSDGGATLFYTAPNELDAVARALPAHGFAVQSAILGYRAKNPVTLGAAERAEVEAFLNDVDADDDVQHVYAGLAG